MVKANEISVDGKTLVAVCIKAINDGKGMSYVAEQTGLKKGTINQRLKVIRDLYPSLAEHLKFPKGAKGGRGGKSVTKIDATGLSELQALVASFTNVNPDVVQENGMALVQGENLTDAQRVELANMQANADINAPQGETQAV